MACTVRGAVVFVCPVGVAWSGFGCTIYFEINSSFGGLDCMFSLLRGDFGIGSVICCWISWLTFGLDYRRCFISFFFTVFL